MGASLKSEVITHIEDLQQEPSDRTLRTLLLLSRCILQVPSRERPDANVVRENAAYIAIKSLFRTSLQRMLNWAEILKKTGPRDRAREVRKDAVGLWAWGEEVAINGANLITKNDKYRSAMSGGIEGEILYLLMELDRFCRENLVDSQDSSSSELTRVRSHQQSYRKPRDEIHKYIRKLRRALPESYRESILVKEEDYLQTVGAGSLSLPEMSDESLQPATEDASPEVGTSTNVSPLSRTTTHFTTDPGHNERLDTQNEDQDNKTTVLHKGSSSSPSGSQSTSLESRRRDLDADNPYALIPGEGFGERNAFGISIGTVAGGKRKEVQEQGVTSSDSTTPASMPVSNWTTPGIQTSVTSPGSSNPVSARDQRIVKRKAVPPSISTLVLPPSRMSTEPSQSHGAVLTGSGIDAKM